ncbi:MAG TPA: M20/M25/M40 family metallo-hydrolase [Bryobacteraceae bacterium]|nr:M20/M25/M40 family metallo-hydrolase [Bryobacteraceae bacterium]
MATAPKTPPRPQLPPLQGRLVRDLSLRPEISEALQWFARERLWINERHLELCRVVAPTFFERPRAEWFCAQLTAMGWNAALDRAGNVIAALGDHPGDAVCVISAHLDTVFAPDRPEDIHYGPDGRILGPGTSDNGSGLSGLLAIAKVLRSSDKLRNLAKSVLLVANVGEEGEGNLNGMRYLCSHLDDYCSAPDRLRAFLVLDGPSIEHITSQALASRRFELTFSGPGGHSWNDHGTPNPVHIVAEAITSYVQHAESEIVSRNRGICSYNFGIIEGGTSVNSIPSSVRTKLDIRSEDAPVLTALSTLLTSVVERSLEQANRGARSGRLTARIKDLGARPGGKLPEDAPLLKAVHAVDAHLNIRSRLDCASTDANVPLSLGLPAISIGAGGQGGGAHTHSEWYQPEGRELGLKRILLLLTLLNADASV